MLQFNRTGPRQSTGIIIVYIVLGAFVALAMALSVMSGVAYGVRRMRIRQAEYRAQTLAELIEARLDDSREMGAVISLGRADARLRDAVSGKLEEKEGVLADLAELRAALRLSMIDVFDRDGAILFGAPGAVEAGAPAAIGERMVFSNQRFVLQALEGAANVYLSNQSSRDSRRMLFSGPIVHPDIYREDRVLGAVTLTTGAEALDEWLAGVGADVLLVKPDGVVFSSSRPEWILKCLEGSEAAGGRRAAPAADLSHSSGLHDVISLPMYEIRGFVDGHERLIGSYSIRFSGEAGWRLLALTPESPDWMGLSYNRVLPILGLGAVGAGGLLVMLDRRRKRKSREARHLHGVAEAYRSIFMDGPDAWIIHDIWNGHIVEANAAAERLFGCGQQELGAYLPYFDATSGRLDPAIVYGKPAEMKTTRADGEKVWIDVRMSRCSLFGIERILAVCRDVSEQKRDREALRFQQEELKQQVAERTAGLIEANRRLRREIEERGAAEAQERKLQENLEAAKRIESLGVLAGGMAHDLNNFLAPLVVLPDIIAADARKLSAQDAAPNFAEIDESLRLMRDSALRATDMIRDLTLVSRRGHYTMVPCDLNRIVRDYLATQDYLQLVTANPGITFQNALAEWPLYFRASDGHVVRVLVNLVHNAVEAMAGAGRIAIETFFSSVDTPQGNLCLVPPGRYVALRVSDTGAGIPAAIMNRIFEPFFTTKHGTDQSGSGLGLAIVNAVIKEHGGILDLDSEVGRGSIFTAYFPEIEWRESPSTEEGPTPPHGGVERILVVDDEAAQRRMAGIALTRLGYTVDAAESGQAAIERVREQLTADAEGRKPRSPYDLYLMDLLMDGPVDGLKAYERLLDMCSGHRAVFVSGIAPTAAGAAKMAAWSATWLGKPYRLAELATAVRSQLDARK